MQHAGSYTRVKPSPLRLPAPRTTFRDVASDDVTVVTPCFTPVVNESTPRGIVALCAPHY